MNLLLLAISGGIDSSVFLDVIATGRLDELTKKIPPLFACGESSPPFFKGGLGGISPTIAYFHHGTPHADDAEVFVRSLAAKYHLPLEIGHTTSSLTSEAAFRDARYAFLRATKERLNADRIVTAHHADDQAETVILHLTRGSGIKGLAGMHADTGEIIRPLLDVPKRDIEAYAKKYAIEWINDPTNSDATFARNRIRHDVIPTLAELNPRIVETLTKTAARLRAVDDYLDETANAWLTVSTRDASLPLATFVALPDIIKSTIIRRIHARAIGHTQRIEEIHIDEVLALAHSTVGGKEKACGDLLFRTTRDATGARILAWTKLLK